MLIFDQHFNFCPTLSTIEIFAKNQLLRMLAEIITWNFDQMILYCPSKGSILKNQTNIFL